ncbi:acetyl-CoA synthetase-like protein [Tilletiaria anomala UBC 951]|uniref:Acetyl-CoA synthetase-like protein n=1 Tax=Tilletiaria anomala (strain ATCC 24038 / CBS 436.72 / UBC 951) TaxID=1037660 RepID=A0A066VIY3_TILAU|nr:acetyl-CoA synthetase-like protein [Tilletiaria anomala UBC 951]KDN41436.1 acetyl-CoA synthetase-like protein [Tilletiaria anomala UBC 951]
MYFPSAASSSAIPPQNPDGQASFSPLSAEAQAQLLPLPRVDAMMTAPGMGSPFELETRLVDGRLQTLYKNLPTSGREYWREVHKAFADRPYIGFNDEVYTYAQIAEQATLVARWLRLHFNVRKGDRVGIIARNMPEFITSFWAIHELGAVVVPINAFGEGDLLTFCILDVDCRVVIGDVERLGKLQPFLPKLNESSKASGSSYSGLVVVPRRGDSVIPAQSRAWSSGKQAGVYCWDELNATYSQPAFAKAHAQLPEEPISVSDNASILFTSGTTSKPKGVLSTQSQHLSPLALVKAASARAYLRRGYTPPDPLKKENALTILILVPLFHTTALSSGIIANSKNGAFLHLLNGWNLQVALEKIEKFKVQGLLGIGFMMREIMTKGMPKQLATISAISHGGSSSSTSLPQEVQKARPGSLLGQGYGLTETNGVAAAIAGDDYSHRPASTGLPPPGVEVIIVDPNTLTQCPSGVAGEVWIRGPGVAKSYYNRPQATAEAFLPDGWFRSGDLGRKDLEGYLYIVDRVKDMIIRGGENISCSMVEDAVYKHPAVQECAAVAFADERLGERVAIVVHTRSDAAKVSQEELEHVAAKNLPKASICERMVRWPQPVS